MIDKKTYHTRVIPVSVVSCKEVSSLMRSLGVSAQGIKIMTAKTQFKILRIEGMRSWAANIIKQCCLSLGADAAINRNALIKDITSTALVFGTYRQLRDLSKKLKNQPFDLCQIGKEISRCISAQSMNNFVLHARDKKFSLKKPAVCGVINITPDSFSGDGLLQVANCKPRITGEILKKAQEMIEAGAMMLDLGGQSSRPGSKPVSENEEIHRVVPAIKAIRSKYKQIIISVDTYRYAVAAAAVDAGADIINDITALRHSPKIIDLVKKYKLGCVLMHMKGTPIMMQKNPCYVNVINEIRDFLRDRIEFCRAHGVEDGKIMIDPGIGFGKRLKDNLTIIHGLRQLTDLDKPIFLGLSRKSFIGAIVNAGISGRLSGTLAATAAAIKNGAKIIRCHDVAQTVDMIKVLTAIENVNS